MDRPRESIFPPQKYLDDIDAFCYHCGQKSPYIKTDHAAMLVEVTDGIRHTEWAVWHNSPKHAVQELSFAYSKGSFLEQHQSVFNAEKAFAKVLSLLESIYDRP